MKRICTLFILLLCLGTAFSQSKWQPTQKELEGPLFFLSSPLLEGRETGKRGILIAAEYIASVMIQHGLLPAGDTHPDGIGWFQDFENDSLFVRNVLGMIKGVDTTKYVVLSAHYDHLGIREDGVYAGADDNASGISGMLALANLWNNKKERPPYNLIFAAWSGEEKDMLGSKYFVQHFTFGKEAFLLNMNFDMISRSDPKDSTCNILEIGVLKGRNDYKEFAERHNRSSGTHFDLDFWETDGNGGSDYISFSAHGIPVMAFFAGLHSEYHSPADTRDKIDWAKMIRVLTLANSCLEDFLHLVNTIDSLE